MKFVVAALAVLSVANGFTSNQPVAFAPRGSVAPSSTELNMGLLSVFRKKKSDSPVLAEVETLTEEQVRSLFFLWNEALQTKDSNIVAKRYAKNPVLLPTISNLPRTDFASIKDYFDAFLKLKPSGKIIEGKITTGINWAQDAGIYEFAMGANGSRVKARYTFVYVFEDGKWRIAHHHSSYLPESIVTGPKITEAEVKSLFYLWNDALATLDATTVAKRYSKNPVLLPTVSDTPRTDFAGLKDYFETFTKLKPQGVILESNVHIGTNWAQDAGIYEFTMGATGQKVKARYSFIYVYEDGEWKIQHHHSSVMPEGIPPSPQPITVSEVRGLFSRWNNALATLDPDSVAKLYSKEGVLLPTVSDTPRTNYATIKDYFTLFLKQKPQGVITSGEIRIGNNWAQDCGVYDFTMGATGKKVTARYSFVYIFEDGEWKISHHHSSVMPEAFLGKKEPVKEEKESVLA